MRISFSLLIILALAFTGCRKVFEKPKWATNVKAPLIKSSLSISNIVRDTAHIKKDPDNSVKIVSSQVLYDLNVDSFATIQVTPYNKRVKLSSLVLDSQTVTRRVSLGELALAMKANGDPTGDFIINNNGKSTIVPPMSNLKAGPVPVDIQQFFEEAEILSGDMYITLKNQLPLNITNLEFELRNIQGGQQITDQIYSGLNVGTSQTKYVNLAGKVVEGVLQVNVLDMDLGAGFIKIDTASSIFITIQAKNLKVKSATAIFPAQNVVDEYVEINLTGLKKDVQLKTATISEGFVTADATSTAGDSVFFNYKIPSATNGSDTFGFNAAVPPGAIHKIFSSNFDGYNLNLKGDPTKRGGRDTVNTFISHLTGRIKYTGRKVHLSLTDSFDVTVKLQNAKPSYVKGYFGKDSIDLGSGSVDIDVFKNIQGGTLNFDTLINVNMVMENGLGLGGKYEITQLKALNSRTGNSKALSISPTNPLIGVVNPALDGNSPTTSTFTLNKADAMSLLNILPDKILYSARVVYNDKVTVTPNPYFDTDYTNFAYKGKVLKPTLNIEVPLSVFASDLILSDTTDFVSDHFKTSVNSGSFSVLVDNGFPLGGDLKIYFLDAGGSRMDSVVSAGNIAPAPIDINKKVISKQPSKITFYVDQNRMQNIMHSRKVEFRVSFSSTRPPASQSHFVKIYSDYSIDFKLVGDFNYTIE